MRKLFPALALLLATGCQKDADVAPGTDEVEIETQGANRSCGVAQVLAIDSVQVKRLVGRSAFGPTYLALQLDTALWMHGTRRLLVRIRKPLLTEGVVCTANGLWYPPFVVTSARLKSGSR